MSGGKKEAGMVRAARGVVIAIGVALLALGAGAKGDGFKYVGLKKCKSCHKRGPLGNQYGVWKQRKHAGAFETLKGEKALEVARKQGITVPPHEAPECQRCHATAAMVGPERLAWKPLLLGDGVQCESCHGPGSRYRKKKIMTDHDRAVAAGLWDPARNEGICLECHNAESPTFPAEGFDFEAGVKEIDHPIPADVKERREATSARPQG
jgi:hypothetical protein